jgi:hypothetical protein
MSYITVIFHGVKLKTYCRNNTFWRFLKNHIEHSPIIFYSGLNYALIDFYEQAKHIRGPWTNFTVSPLPLNSLLATLKNIF